MHMVAQHLFQSALEQMRRGVRTADALPALLIDADGADIARFHLAADHAAIVQEFAALVLLNVGDDEFAVRPFDIAMVADLTAHFGVHGRLIQHDQSVRPLADSALKLVLRDDGEDLALRSAAFIADELRRGHLLAELHAGPAEVSQRLSGLSRAGFLLLHQLLERLRIHVHAFLVNHFLGQVERETVGVIELEGVRAGENGLALLLVALEHVAEDLHAAVDGLGEVLLLRAHNAGDIRLLFAQLRILALILMDNGIDHVIQERMVDAEKLSVTRRTPQKPPQHIAASLVRGQHAVADHERGAADMVGDDAQRNVRLCGFLIVRAGDLRDLVGNVHHRIHIEQRSHVLAHAGKALQAHAGVDVLLLQLGIIAVAIIIELREHDVPDLDVAVAVAADGAAGFAAAVLFAAVIINFGAGTARAGAVLPEIVLLAEAEDMALGNADHIAPDGEGLVVGGGRLIACKDRRIQPIRLKADPLGAGQEFPRPGNGFLLEIIAEGKVA